MANDFSAIWFGYCFFLHYSLFLVPLPFRCDIKYHWYVCGLPSPINKLNSICKILNYLTSLRTAIPNEKKKNLLFNQKKFLGCLFDNIETNCEFRCFVWFKGVKAILKSKILQSATSTKSHFWKQLKFANANVNNVKEIKLSLNYFRLSEDSYSSNGA